MDLIHRDHQHANLALHSSVDWLDVFLGLGYFAAAIHGVGVNRM
jgi:hypothetical protein